MFNPISLDLKKEIPKGTSVKLELFTNDGNVVYCSAYVVWVMERTNPKNVHELLYDTGMQFEDMDDNDRKLIGGLVDKFNAGDKDKWYIDRRRAIKQK